MDENESVTVIRLATGSWEIGLDHAEVRRVATERIPEAEEQSRLEGQHPFDGLELRDRKQNSDCLGNEFVSENEAVPLLLARARPDLAPRAVVVRVFRVACVTADAVNAATMPTDGEE